jgi:hypothetical protein
MTEQHVGMNTDEYSAEMMGQRLGVAAQFRPFPKMVGWYDPLELMRTAIMVVLSSIFGQMADRRAARRSQAAAELGDGELFDYTRDETYLRRDEIWIDYAADLGDGWNSTYNIAYSLAQKKLVVEAPGRTGQPITLPRGDVLVFGGDQVYPVANRAEYKNRTVRPYEAALRDSVPPGPDVFAIPGNHDWYDNLVSFSRVFCSRRPFGGWRTRQERSYFALELPHNWWLIGADVQLASDIDTPQLDYFKSVAAMMGPDDKVILCLAEPHWIYARAYNRYDDNCNDSNLAYLEHHVFKGRVFVLLAGDLHHYRRHANQRGVQKITCGGGGAFLHPTHGVDVQTMRGGYTMRAAYPPLDVSRKLTWKNLFFPLLNPKFGAVTGVLYLLLAWAVKVDLSGYAVTQYADVVGHSVRAMLASQAAVFWAAVLIGGFFVFTETHSKVYKYIAGPLHAFVHIAAVLAIAWWATFVTVGPWGLEFGSIPQFLMAGVLIFAVGSLAGPMIIGIYFLVSLNLFKRHTGEAFSSLRIPDWKCFLRMRVSAEGVTIYPIGIRKVWKAWRINVAGVETPEWVPDHTAPRRRHGTPPELIEQPIVVPNGELAPSAR